MHSSVKDTALTETKKSYVSDSDVLIRKLYKEAKKVPTFMRWISLNNPSMNESRTGTGRRDNTVSWVKNSIRAFTIDSYSEIMPDGVNYGQNFLKSLALYFYNVDIKGFSPQGFPFTRQAHAAHRRGTEARPIRAVIYTLCGEEDWGGSK